MSIDECRIVELPRISDARGNLAFVEGGRQVPFEIRRVCYLYDVPGGTGRGGHARRELRQLVIATSGSLDVLLDDGRRRNLVRLDRPDRALSLCPMIWRAPDNFSSGAVCTVLASELYDERDCFRDYSAFRAALPATP